MKILLILLLLPFYSSSQVITLQYSGQLKIWSWDDDTSSAMEYTPATIIIPLDSCKGSILIKSEIWGTDILEVDSIKFDYKDNSYIGMRYILSNGQKRMAGQFLLSYLKQSDEIMVVYDVFDRIRNKPMTLITYYSKPISKEYNGNPQH